jgi:N-acetylmuramoyl-L-alanine amidase
MYKIERPSPNFDDRKGPPFMVVIHYTGMKDAASAMDRLCDPEAKVSSHYTIDEDGSIYSLVPEERRAWHAGVGIWDEERDLNSVSIGIEMVNPGHEFGPKPYSPQSISSLISLLDDIKTRWEILDHHIIGHSDLAPDRKADPGEWFPWEELARHNHGLWLSDDHFPPEALSAMGPPLGVGDQGIGVFTLRAGLGKFGYGILADQVFDEEARQTVIAFQRHFLPTQIGSALEGAADATLRMTLMRLLRQKIGA